MPFDKEFMFRFAAKLKGLAADRRQKTVYECAECGAVVKVDGDVKVYTCEHTEATIIANLSAITKSHGGLRHDGIF